MELNTNDIDMYQSYQNPSYPQLALLAARPGQQDQDKIISSF